MKRTFGLFLALITVLTALAQTQDNALYVFRNDGQFNAFLRDDILSISLSKVDTLGIEHSNCVVQEFQTTDSLYRIPISAIDSVTMTQPKVIYQKDVMHLTADHLPYILEIGDDFIRFSGSTPAALLPEEAGTVITTDVYEGVLQYGFSGRTIAMEAGAEGLKYNVEPVGLDEIYEQLVYVGKSCGSTDEPAQSRAVTADNVFRFHLPPIEMSSENGALKATFQPEISVDYVIFISMWSKPLVSVNIRQRYKGSVGISTDYDDTKMELLSAEDVVYASDHALTKGLQVRVPLGTTGGMLVLDPGFFYKASFGIEGALQVELDAVHLTRLVYNEHQRECSMTVQRFDINPKLTAMFNGEASLGICADFLVCLLHEKLVCVGGAAFIGGYAKFNAGFQIDKEIFSDISAYNMLKDTKVDAGLFLAGSPFAVVFTKRLDFKINTGYQRPSKIPSTCIHIPKKEWSLFPAFSTPSYSYDGEGRVSVSSKPGNNPFMPMKLGFALWEEGSKYNEYLDRVWIDQEYAGEADWAKSGASMSANLNRVRAGHTYRIYPMFRFLLDTPIYAMPHSGDIAVKGNIETQEATDIRHTRANLSAKVDEILLKDPMLDEKGFVYGMTEDLDIAGNRRVSFWGSNWEDFSCDVGNLTPGVTYYFRPYIKISDSPEPFYGDIKSFKTIDANEEDFRIEVATQEATGLRSRSAVLRGKITQGQFYDNPYFQTLGFVYSTTHADISNTSNMGGTFVQPMSIGEEYEAELTGLTPETTYYYRAVAKTSNGDSYGEIRSFKTPEPEQFFGHNFHLPSGLLWCHSFVGQDETGAGQAKKLKLSEIADDPDYQAMATQGWRLPTKEEALELCIFGDWHCDWISCAVYPAEGGYGMMVYPGAYWTSTSGYWTDADYDNPYMWPDSYIPGLDEHPMTYCLLVNGGATHEGGSAKVTYSITDYDNANYVWLVKPLDQQPPTQD